MTESVPPAVHDADLSGQAEGPVERLGHIVPRLLGPGDPGQRTDPAEDRVAKLVDVEGPTVEEDPGAIDREPDASASAAGATGSSVRSSVTLRIVDIDRRSR
jgi:hypothetical protein